MYWKPQTEARGEERGAGATCEQKVACPEDFQAWKGFEGSDTMQQKGWGVVGRCCRVTRNQRTRPPRTATVPRRPTQAEGEGRGGRNFTINAFWRFHFYPGLDILIAGLRLNRPFK